MVGMALSLNAITLPANSALTLADKPLGCCFSQAALGQILPCVHALPFLFSQKKKSDGDGLHRLRPSYSLNCA